MVRNWIKQATLTALAAVAVLTGCDLDSRASADRIAGPDNLLFSSDVRLLKGNNTEAKATKVIGIKGGSIIGDLGSIVVPARAVTEPTTFYVHIKQDGYLSIELTATRKDAAGNTIDVGGNGFPVPVKATLSYKNAVDNFDPYKLKVYYMVDGTYDGRMEEVPTTVDTGKKTVSAQLQHFSGYIIGQN